MCLCVCKLMYFVLCVTKCATYLGQDPLVNEILNLKSVTFLVKQSCNNIIIITSCMHCLGVILAHSSTHYSNIEGSVGLFYEL